MRLLFTRRGEVLSRLVIVFREGQRCCAIREKRERERTVVRQVIGRDEVLQRRWDRAFSFRAARMGIRQLI